MLQLYLVITQQYNIQRKNRAKKSDFIAKIIRILYSKIKTLIKDFYESWG